ncbi:MAG: hypothetical protein IKN54_07945 [Lachnospiraceae bacterium]|nr:hypothetical protein [Lachnospiraceae bacterium]
MKTTILDKFLDKASWEAFLDYKISANHITKKESDAIRQYISDGCYIDMAHKIADNTFPGENPKMITINKKGTAKKRIVYSFSEKVNISLKFIAHHLNEYDSYFCDNCYAFRSSLSVRHAFRRITALNHQNSLSGKYCLKVDISNYFNSIDVNILLDKLQFIDDEILRSIFTGILTNDMVIKNNIAVHDKHGAMAGLPIAPFFANVYLTAVDKYFDDCGITYFRYSDDIILFADTYEDLLDYQNKLYSAFDIHHLKVNPQKEHIYAPGDTWEFLGFSFREGVIDLSSVTKQKIKAKIKRKAHALMRWQRNKNLPVERAAKGFINAMNKKFFGYNDEDDFTWSRWFFPILTTDNGLAEIDSYMQQYIRHIITGRHYKGNYRIPYSQIKDWGYISLVNIYHK